MQVFVKLALLSLMQALSDVDFRLEGAFLDLVQLNNFPRLLEFRFFHRESLLFSLVQVARPVIDRNACFVQFW